MESIVVGVTNVIFRVFGIIVVTFFVQELEEAATQQIPTSGSQVYYEGQMIPMNFSNDQEQQEEIGWNLPKQV